jgi:hypothetical protein
MLQHDLAGRRSYPLAVPLLDDTANASDKYLNAAQVPGHSAIVHSIKGEQETCARKSRRRPRE